MKAMSRKRGSVPQRKEAASASRRKRGTHNDGNRMFVQAFADALRDILEYERRRVA
jgi:hypothetical protein